jgi:hypothetical protein
LAALFPPVLAGYALLDRGFAWLHIPGTPIFAGELLVGVSVIVALVATPFLRRGMHHSAVAKLLLIFGAWGLLRTLPYLGRYGTNAMRDAVLWYYSLLVIPVVALVLAFPALPNDWATRYRRFVPWLLVWSPVAVFFDKASTHGLGPIVPGSPGIALWSHKPGNLATNAVIAVAFLWLVPGTAWRRRYVLTGLATLVLLVIATQNRGGFLAGLAGLAVLWLFASKRARMVGGMLAIVALLLVVGWSLNVHLKGEQNRSVSVGQLAQNVGSLTGKTQSQSNSNLQSTAAWRGQLWTAVVQKVKDENKVLTGLGFGRDIAAELGFQGQQEQTLRSPHNSHIDVFARMGAVGAALWILLWIVWYAVALRGRSRLRAIGRHLERGLVELSIVGVTAILVNAYFDPTLESPQVAIWLWTLVGLTIGVIRAASYQKAPKDTAPAVTLATASR